MGLTYVDKSHLLRELKVAKGKKSPSAALREGLAQIRARKYVAELAAAGSSPAQAFAVAFDGKDVWVKSAAETPKRRPAKKRPASKKTKR